MFEKDLIKLCAKMDTNSWGEDWFITQNITIYANDNWQAGSDKGIAKTLHECKHSPKHH